MAPCHSSAQQTDGMIEVLAATEPSAPPSAAHLLPCEIEYTGPAIVSAYFKPTTGKRGLEATFRGRALRGAVLPIPDGYTGALLQDTVQGDVADSEERRWLHRGALESFTLWKHDDAPHDDEPVFKAMRWASVANVLHADHGEEIAEDAAEEPPSTVKLQRE